MGRVDITIGVGDPQGNRFEELEVIVDTGATFTKLPRELLERLGVPVERSVRAELADGRNVMVDVGRTMIRLEGQEFPTPVIFAEQGAAPAAGGSRAGGRLAGRGPYARTAGANERAVAVGGGGGTDALVGAVREPPLQGR